MMKRFVSILLVVMLMACLLNVASGETSTEYVNSGKLSYDLTAQVNNGEEMELEFWVQVELANIYQKWCDAYTELHPNIKFNITQGSNEDHFKKLGMSLIFEPMPLSSLQMLEKSYI